EPGSLPCTGREIRASLPRVLMPSAVTILGAGSWGTALAVHLGRVGHEVTLWARDAAVAESLARDRENRTYLPGVALPETVRPTESLPAACGSAETAVFVCPSSAVRSMAETVRALLPDEALVVTASKGVERATRMTMSAVLEQVLDTKHRG